MVSSVTDQITSIKNATAIAEAADKSKNGISNDMTDKNMFLKLMLKQMEYQDPTEPTSNEEWLSQMAQYSSLESAQNTQSAIENLSSLVSSLADAYSTSAGITQTLSLLGKEVTIMDPEDKTGETKITGKVEEASFDGGIGMVKVNGKNYSIAYITSVKDNAGDSGSSGSNE